MKKSKFLLAVEVIQDLLDDFIYMCDSRKKSSYFTREGNNKLDFKTTMLFMLNFIRKSLQIELDHFFEQFLKGEPLISKQGFTAARRKIKPEAFIKLDQTLVEWFYNQNDLLIFDRGYPSIEFFAYLIDAGVKFVIRIPIDNYRKTIDPALSDQMIEFKKKKRPIRLRALTFDLNSGIKEILITNLFEETLNIHAFKSLYFKRWGIETKYNELKNKLQIQKFSGDTPQLIE